MDIIPRSQWRARPAVKSPPRVRHTHVEVHHGASNNDSADRDPAAVMREYQRMHLEDKGWSDIFYNLGLSPDGRLWEGRGIGKQSQGKALTVVLLGNYMSRQPTEAQKRVILQLVDETGGRERVDWHKKRAMGTKFASDCPGTAVISWLEQIKSGEPEPSGLSHAGIDLQEDDAMVRFIRAESVVGEPPGRVAGWLATTGQAGLIPINGAPPVPFVTGKVVAVEGSLVVTTDGDDDFPTFNLADVH